MKILDRQSLADIAIQYCGDASAAYAIAELNDISVTNELNAGDELILPDAINSNLVNYYSNNGIVPATMVTDDDMSADDGGLGYMALGFDFIVS
jgi:hypothetical protein